MTLSKGTLDLLLEAGWIRPRGRRRVPGRPATWGTTEAFLDHFGLDSIDALPGIDELKAAGLLDRRAGVSSIAMRQDDLLAAEKSADDAEEIGEDGDHRLRGDIGDGPDVALDREVDPTGGSEGKY